MSFAKAVVSGVLVSDPEKRFTPNNHAVTSFSIAVENALSGGKGAPNEAAVLRITCWRNLAEAVVGKLQKGDAVMVEGKLIINSFQGQDGVQKKLFEIEAASIDKLPGQPEPILPVAGEGQAGGGYNGGVNASARTSSPAYEANYQPSGNAPPGHFSSEDLLTEDDIPF